MLLQKSANAPEELKKQKFLKQLKHVTWTLCPVKLSFSVPLIKEYTYDELKAAQLALGS